MEHNFKKKFGQNFLTDKNLLRAIVSDAQVEKGDNVLEIGAGAGALTAVLAGAAKKVVAYEIDEELKSTLEGLNLANVTFVFADALKEDIKTIESRFGGQNFKLVANLPYYITTPLLFKFLEESDKLQSLTVMVQKEVAQRIVAKPGGKDYGVLTVMIAFYGVAKITRKVDRAMFTPMPNVDSAVITITKEDKFHLPREEFFEFVKICFSMRRKTLANNLSKGYHLSKQALEEVLDKDILLSRAEKFSLEEFVDIFKRLKKL